MSLGALWSQQVFFGRDVGQVRCQAVTPVWCPNDVTQAAKWTGATAGNSRRFFRRDFDFILRPTDQRWLEQRGGTGPPHAALPPPSGAAAAGRAASCAAAICRLKATGYSAWLSAVPLWAVCWEIYGWEGYRIYH